MKMCGAFAQEVKKIRLHAFARKSTVDESDKSLFKYYDVPELFEIALYKQKPMRYPLMGLLAGCKPGRILYGRNVAAIYYAGLLGNPIIVEMHQMNRFHHKEHRFFHRITRMSNFLGVVSISGNLSRDLLKTYPDLDASKILVAPDASDENKFADASISDFGTGFHIGYTGSLSKGKGFLHLVSIAKELPWCNFHIMGDTDTLKKREISINELPKNIILHGLIAPSEIRKYVASFDIVLAPYQNNVHSGGGDIASYMSPLKIFEYMAAKRPIIASNLSVLREVLTHNQNCILCESNSTKDWVDAITKMYSNPGLASSIADRAYRDWRETYSWSARAQTIVEWIRHRQAGAA